MTKPIVIHHPLEMQQIAIREKREGRNIVVVPTMGALHEGHRRLIEKGRESGDILIVTIFVNPTQFAPSEDLARYPRTFEADRELCAKESVDYIFLPRDEDMYPEDYATWVDVERLGEGLCGKSRPTHFRGVTTVCTKLFLITQADRAVFGWKDAQQQIIIRRMVRDLNIPIEIIGVETVREADGLAMSSRNAYLSAEQRQQAPVLHRALEEAKMAILSDDTIPAQRLCQMVRDRIERETDGRIDYVECVSLQNLQAAQTVKPGETLLALAVNFGKTRLIDNIRI
ncbi:MAG: pantoate--beta-alanine ligase [Candidatus Sumerlaeota bacterium]